MKRILSLITAAAVIVCVALVPASALGGKWEGVTWEIKDGVLSVSGGNIPDCTASAAAPWLKFADLVTSITIGDGVSVIGERAFEDMTSAKAVSFANVATIGKMAFSGCTSLETLQLPESAKTIADAAFAECSALTKASIPQGVTFIGEAVFEGCTSLKEITSASERYPAISGVLTDSKNSSILRYPPAKKGDSFTAPEGITAVSAGAFRDCTTLIIADLGGITSIGDGAFYGCTSLAEVKIPDTTIIGRASFYGCSVLGRISFGASLTSIGNDAFRDCSSLSVADFAGNAPSANEGIFYGTAQSFTVTIAETSSGFGDNWLGYPVIRHGSYGGEIDGILWNLDTENGTLTITGEGDIPDFEYPSDAPWYKYRKIYSEILLDGISGIGKNSFRYSAVKSLDLPESVSRIGDGAFYGCELLESVSADGVQTLGAIAFFSNTSLTWVKMSGVTSVGDQAFSGCDNLWWVYFGKTAPTIGKYVFDGTDTAMLSPMSSSGYTGDSWSDIYCEEYFPGDASGDGKLNLSDVSIVMKSVAKWNISFKKISADTNLDGRINLSDAANMLKYIAKWNITIGISL